MDIGKKNLAGTWVCEHEFKAFCDSLQEDIAEPRLSRLVEHYGSFELFIGVFMKSYFKHRNKSRASRRA